MEGGRSLAVPRDKETKEGRRGEAPVASAISQIEMERGGGGWFFSRRLTVIRSAFIRV